MCTGVKQSLGSGERKVPLKQPPLKQADTARGRRKGAREGAREREREGGGVTGGERACLVHHAFLVLYSSSYGASLS